MKELKAVEANRIAVDAVTEEMKGIYEAIEAEAKKGRLSVSLVSITPASASVLKSQGYLVQSMTMTNYLMITVSW